MSHNIWSIVNRSRASFTRSATTRTRKALNLQIKPILDKLKTGAIPTDDFIDTVITQEPIKQMMIDIHYSVGKKFAAAVFKSFQKAQIEFSEDIFMNNVLSMIEGQGAVMITAIDQATKNSIKRVIAQEIKRGADINQIALEISKKLKKGSFIRSITIARTEVIRASNAGALTGANMTKLALQKEWISTLDDRTRQNGYDHVDANGQKVGINESFLVSGEMLDHPASFDGSPGNTINCRCTIGFTRL